MIKTVALVASFVLNVLLLVLRVQVSVSNTQTQDVRQTQCSVNNNQNVNINLLLDAESGKKVGYTNVRVKTVEEFQAVAEPLTVFQRMFMVSVALPGETLVSYPVFVTPGVTTRIYSVSTNSGDWHRDWFKINIK